VWDQLRSSYDRVASSYEAHFLDELADKPFDRDLLQGFAESVDDPVAEIGCGPGQVGAFVRKWGRRVVGVDLSVEMARLANSRLDGALAADMRRLPFESGQLGGLIVFYAVIHLPRIELGAALTEFWRVLRPGGRLVLSAHEGQGEIAQDEFLGQPVPFVATLFEMAELVGATTEAGFEARAAQRRAPYPSEHQTFRLYIEAERER
jgi:SAM-dependent methyltransferase